MYITRIEINNFQIHKHLVLDLEPGINVIVGATNKGKTAIIRALNWFFHNRPINANTAYKRIGSKKPMSIIIEDNRGNRIIREPSFYKINNDDPLTAFGRDVPSPIMELFPMRPINWQRQLDPPFLVLDTGGKAAKIIGQTTGAKDQEMIMAEWKADKAETRNEIKRTEQNLTEAKEAVEQLKEVPDLLEAAEELLGIQQSIAKDDERLTILKGILHQLEEVEDHIVDTDFDTLLADCDAVGASVKMIDTKTLKLMNGNSILENIEEIDSQPQIDFDGMDGSLTFIQEKLAARGNLSARISNIETILERLEEIGTDTLEFDMIQGLLFKLTTIKDRFKELQDNIKSRGAVDFIVNRVARDIHVEEGLQNDLDQLIKEAGGICPLCMQPWEKDKC
jgi:DNA repair ATPase RecN